MKRMVAFMLAAVLLTSFTACSSTIQENKVPQPSAQNGYYPITVEDHAGRKVVIESEPQRIISCYYITTSLLMALDLEDKIVGVEDNPDYRPIYELSAPQLLELPWVGTAKVLDVEGSAALEPDLVILPLRLKESAEILEELGIDVLLVNPESQELLNEMITMVGAATGTTEKAESLLSFIDEKQQYLADAVADAARPAVYLAGNSGLLQTAGNAMYQSDMIRLAGGRNVAGEVTDTYWAEVDYEQLLTWDPDYIILASNAAYTIEDVLADPNLTDCIAVKNKNVYQIPAEAEAWDSPVPSSILGALWLASVLHPDLVTETTCNEMMDDYYETFYDFTYSGIKK